MTSLFLSSLSLSLLWYVCVYLEVAPLELVLDRTPQEVATSEEGVKVELTIEQKKEKARQRRQRKRKESMPGL